MLRFFAKKIFTIFSKFRKIFLPKHHQISQKTGSCWGKKILEKIFPHHAEKGQSDNYLKLRGAKSWRHIVISGWGQKYKPKPILRLPDQVVQTGPTPPNRPRARLSRLRPRSKATSPNSTGKMYYSQAFRYMRPYIFIYLAHTYAGIHFRYLPALM